jgi:hypothetical protein
MWVVCVVCVVWHGERAIPCYRDVAIALLFLLLLGIVALAFPGVTATAILH